MPLPSGLMFDLAKVTLHFASRSLMMGLDFLTSLDPEDSGCV
jgi:hypothetical protein